MPQAIILAAGSSTRTYPLTTTIPKPLIPIWNRPLLSHLLMQLRGLTTEALIIVGYQKEQIIHYFGEEHYGIRLRYIEQTKQRGTADAVLAAREFVTDRTIILNGDDLYDREDLQTLITGGRGILVTQAQDPKNCAVVDIEDNIIKNIIEKPENATRGVWCSVGGYCVELEDLHLLDGLSLSSRGELELPDFILQLSSKSCVRPQKIKQWWCPITYAWDILKASHFIWSDSSRAERLDLHDDVNHDLIVPASTTITSPVQIGNNVCLGEGVRIIGPTSIGPSCTISAGATLNQVSLFNNVFVGEGANISNSVVGASAHIGNNVTFETRPGEQLSVNINGKSITPNLSQLGAIIGDNATITDKALVTAGSLIPPTATYS